MDFILITFLLAAPLALPLYIPFKESLIASKVPTLLKNAYVIRVHKKGSISVTSIYQPISLTPIPCRLLEKLIKKAVFSCGHFIWPSF